MIEGQIRSIGDQIKSIREQIKSIGDQIKSIEERNGSIPFHHDWMAASDDSIEEQIRSIGEQIKSIEERDGSIPFRHDWTAASDDSTILFGSQARGTARPDSDADIAVNAPGIDVLSLSAELAEVLDREVDVVPLEDASIPLLEHLIRDGIVVHEGYPGAGALWRSRTLATLETDRPWFTRMSDAWLAHVKDRGFSRG